MSRVRRLSAISALGIATAVLVPVAPAAAAPSGFGVPASYFSGYGSQDFASGDVDGDGVADLILNRNAANVDQFAIDPSSGVNLLLGRPGGGYAEPVPYVAGGEPFKIVSSDLNGDGLTDVATANPNGTLEEPTLGSVSVFLADGAGGFRPAALYTDVPYPVGITAADVDGDGDVDLATINYTIRGTGEPPGGVYVQRNDGTGAFGPARNFRVPTGIEFQIGSGDLDGDDSVDLVVGGFAETFSVLYGLGDGTFLPAQQVVAPQVVAVPTVADLDADGDGELLITVNEPGGGFYLYPGTPSGPGTPTLYTEGRYASDLVVVDLDADGLLDVVTPTLPSRGVRVYYGTGTVTLGEAVSVRMADPPQYLEVIDADADGSLDLVTTSPEYASPFEPEITPHYVSVAYAGHSVPVADLALTSDCEVIVLPGRGRPCTLTIRNQGPATATGVVLTSGPQPRLTVLGTPTTSAGACKTNEAGVALRCDVPSLRSGATVTVRFDLASSVIKNDPTYENFRPSVYSSTADRGVDDNAVELRVRTPKCTVTGLDRQPDGSLRGTEGPDVICGNTEDDPIFGLGGDDLIYGSRGDDVVDAGSGNDVVYGQNGDDALLGGDGDDLLVGGNGADPIDGGGGVDDCRPEGGANPPPIGCP